MMRGLVIGKFFPPHRGHKFLINTALSQIDHLDILVCVQSDQTISGELRRQWLQEIHPSAHVRTIEDPGHDDDSEFWAQYTVRVLGRAPDVVFSSEPYGERYAAFLGCGHVMVDRERKHVPISASQVRAAPLRYWEFLEPCVRAHFAKRVRIVGAESTGKTTLARTLAEHYSTTWVPEYARDYCQKLQAGGIDLWGYKWRSEEFLEIARRQQQLEERMAREANRILICDTDALSTAIWHERYLRSRSPEVEAIAASRICHLRLLCACDVPFVQDGLRDGENIRQWMTNRFQSALMESKSPWVTVSGDYHCRLQVAITEIDKLLA